MLRKKIFQDYDKLCFAAARTLANRIETKPDLVIGFPTGSTPEGVYSQLVTAYKAGAVDFSKATSFNMDEYYPIKKANSQSYDYFMRDQLISHVNLPEQNFHILNGEAEDAEAECAAYEAAIRDAGYVDFFLCGLGVNGHIAFNEPAEALVADTHREALTPSTIEANARFFASPEDVPRHALTIGLGTLLKSKEILLLACGESKGPALRELFYGNISTRWPVTFLQLHPNVTVLMDEAAAGAGLKEGSL